MIGKYMLSGKYLNGDAYGERCTESEARSTIEWIFKTDNTVHPFGSASSVIDWRTLTVEIDEH